jgi:hypothetical protein
MSTIPGAGFGVFATRCIQPWMYICKYGGVVYKDVTEVEMAGVIGDSDAVYYSPSDAVGIIGSKLTFGPYVNDPRDDTRCNCRIVYANGMCKLMALESEIDAGDELFLPYGDDYWRVFGNRVSNV